MILQTRLILGVYIHTDVIQRDTSKNFPLQCEKMVKFISKHGHNEHMFVEKKMFLNSYLHQYFFY